MPFGIPLMKFTFKQIRVIELHFKIPWARNSKKVDTIAGIVVAYRNRDIYSELDVDAEGKKRSPVRDRFNTHTKSSMFYFQMNLLMTLLVLETLQTDSNWTQGKQPTINNFGKFPHDGLSSKPITSMPMVVVCSRKSGGGSFGSNSFTISPSLIQ